MPVVIEKNDLVEIISDLEHFTASSPSVVTIGMFDGIHLGHQKILQQLTLIAQQKKMRSTVFTFHPHPRHVLSPDTDMKLILTLEEKVQLLESFHIDQLVIYPFSKDFAQTSAEDFVHLLLVNKLQMKHLVIGHDHRLGKNKSGHFSDLKTLSHRYNFELEKIDAQQIDSVSISSTKIRNALIEGDISTANNFLQRTYSIRGKVVHGKKIGRSLGFPTANIAIDSPLKIIPKDGVYWVASHINGNLCFGMLSIGKNPTIAGKGKSIEVHFFDFEGDLYHQDLTIHFLEWLRQEEKFDSLKALTEQLIIDEQQCRQKMKKYHQSPFPL